MTTTAPAKADDVCAHTAHSLSRRVRENWDSLVPGARLVGVFERACNLLSTGGRVTALVLPEIGNGPLNIVVRARHGAFVPLQPDQRVVLLGHVLVIGSLRITLDGAETWEPRPDWVALRRLAARSGYPTRILRLAAAQASDLGLLTLVPGVGDPGLAAGPIRGAIATPAARGAQELRAGLAGPVHALRRGARLLAGLGEGLTPAGDDFLAGAMIGIWLAQSDPQHTCQILLEESAPRTTALASSLLEAAAAGECSEPWHRLLQALAGPDGPGIERAVRTVLASGSTSGADTLAGFLWTSQAGERTRTKVTIARHRSPRVPELLADANP